MKIGQLAQHVYVTGQVEAEDLDDLAQQGIRTIINNRPDGEGRGQPRSAELAAKAECLGMAYLHIPIVSGAITAADVAEFGRALNSADVPVLLFCKSGARSAMLWRLCEAE